MSLGGIAIAIGAMVDAAIVMIENAHSKLEAGGTSTAAIRRPARRWRLVVDASVEVGPALFVSLLIITLSFVPVFALEAQAGRMFKPLAYTKTYAMAAAAALGDHARARADGLPDPRSHPGRAGESDRPRGSRAYRPQLRWVLRFPKATIASRLALAATAYPVSRLGGEFMPPLDEGDLLYMPTALPGLSAAKAAELLQLTDRMIKSVPEVDGVFGKVGRAETATDPAPLEMIETTIRFKPRDQWRPGMTIDRLVDELDRTVRVPGLSNIWVPPIRNRIDMLATGIKSPIGVKVAGTDLAEVNRLTRAIERVARDVPGVASALAERLEGGRYLDVTIDRAAAARYGMSIVEIQDVIAAAVGGENIGETVEGLARFPISVRYPRELRDSVDEIRMLPIVTDSGAQIPLSALASVRIVDGPPMLRSENARLSGWVYVDARGRDLVSVVRDLQAAVLREVDLPAGLLGVVVGPVRVPRAGEGAPRLRGAVHAARDPRAAVPGVRPVRRGAGRHAGRAVRAGRRLLAAVGARLLDLRRDGDRLHRARGRRRGVRRRDADLPEAGVGGAPRGRRAADRGAPARGDRGGRGAARPAEGHDRRGHHGRPAADHARGTARARRSCSGSRRRWSAA